MAPRKYEMGKRAAAVARTRGRIVAAAMKLYQEQPVTATSMQEVAREADVSPGTVLNHFESPDELAEAVVEELVRTLEAPTSAVFAGHRSPAERLRALSRSLARFFERSEPWFHVHEREQETVQAFADGARRFDERVEELIREALGSTAEAGAVLVIRVLLAPPTFAHLRSRGEMDADAAADLMTEVAVAWLEKRREKGGVS
jgi:AcrR family transcriptional regulator